MTNIKFDVSGPASCANCDWRGDASACEEICDIQERIAPGEIVPCGQCPECGALCHLDPKPVTLSECCHAPVGYDAYIDSNDEMVCGPYDACICTNCSMEEPKVWDGKSLPWPRDKREGGVDLPEGVEEPEAPESHEYLFDATLLASFRVTAPNEAAARAKLQAHLDCADSNFGAWEDSGDPINAEASIDNEGELELVEVDGEAV